MERVQYFDTKKMRRGNFSVVEGEIDSNGLLLSYEILFNGKWKVKAHRLVALGILKSHEEAGDVFIRVNPKDGEMIQKDNPRWFQEG